MSQMVKVLEQVQRTGGTSAQIAEAMGMPRAAVSAHLASLHSAGCVARERVPQRRAGRPQYRYIVGGSHAL